MGFINAFGIFQEHYRSHQLSDYSDFDISWIGSFSTFALFGGAPLAGVLVDRVGPTVRELNSQARAIPLTKILDSARSRQFGHANCSLYDLALHGVLPVLSCAGCSSWEQYVVSVLPCHCHGLLVF